MAGVNASQIEAGFKEAFEDVSKNARRKRGRRLESAIIQSLYVIQQRFDEINLFDVEVTFAYGVLRKDISYKTTLNKNGIGRPGGYRQTVHKYVKDLYRYDQKQSHIQIYNQMVLSKRIAEIYRGVLRPMKITEYRD